MSTPTGVARRQLPPRGAKSRVRPSVWGPTYKTPKREGFLILIHLGFTLEGKGVPFLSFDNGASYSHLGRLCCRFDRFSMCNSHQGPY